MRMIGISAIVIFIIVIKVEQKWRAHWHSNYCSRIIHINTSAAIRDLAKMNDNAVLNKFRGISISRSSRT